MPRELSNVVTSLIAATHFDFLIGVGLESRAKTPVPQIKRCQTTSNALTATT